MFQTLTADLFYNCQLTFTVTHLLYGCYSFTKDIAIIGKLNTAKLYADVHIS